LRTGKLQRAAFDVYYEHLLLLSFWSDVKNEVGAREQFSSAAGSPAAVVEID
jgi:hypothetical protein